MPWQEGHPRNQALADIDTQGKEHWKKSSGYHQRSLAENAMYRLKELFGDHLASRVFESQVTEVHARIAAMNVMTYLGMPVSVRVGTAALSVYWGVGEVCHLLYLCTNAINVTNFFRDTAAFETHQRIGTAETIRGQAR